MKTQILIDKDILNSLFKTMRSLKLQLGQIEKLLEDTKEYYIGVDIAKEGEDKQIVKGCGKSFYKIERVGNRGSGHDCTCGNNKWNYLCPECEEAKKK